MLVTFSFSFWIFAVLARGGWAVEERWRLVGVDHNGRWLDCGSGSTVLITFFSGFPWLTVKAW